MILCTIDFFLHQRSIQINKQKNNNKETKNRMMGREKHASETNMVEVLHWYVECGHKCVTVNRYVRVN